MTTITNGAIVFDADELTWFADNYGGTEWIVYFHGMDEITTHDRHYPGDDVAGEPFTEETVRAYLAEFDSRFGPGSPMDRELPGDPGYAVALHYGVPAFGSHEHSYAINPPGGSIARPGDCACGHTWAEAEKRQAEELAAHLAEVEWAVWVAGLGVLTRHDNNPANPPFTEDAAREFANFANAEMQWIRRDGPNQAVLLHYGQPVVGAAATQ